ncbi:MAG TPA: ribonuclease HII [Bacteroidales bacterium]|nr:ribonuclease HII [Bacteroidales bacterium]
MLRSFFSRRLTEAGCDEAGRGALAGPVVAAAVILPKRYRNERLDDSKKLSASLRETLREEICEKAVSWNVAMVDNNEIDQVNILRATYKAMHLAIEGLSRKPEFLLVDGNYFIPFKKIPFKTIVKGDGKFMSIAAASVLAKTYRDEYMIKIHEEYPQYGWKTNKGYPTPEHKQAIDKYGITPYHRHTFNLGDSQMDLFEKKTIEE